MLYNHLFLTFSSQICHTQKIHSRTERQKNEQSINFKYQLYLMSLGFVQRALEKNILLLYYCAK